MTLPCFAYLLSHATNAACDVTDAKMQKLFIADTHTHTHKHEHTHKMKLSLQMLHLNSISYTIFIANFAAAVVFAVDFCYPVDTPHAAIGRVIRDYRHFCKQSISICYN